MLLLGSAPAWKHRRDHEVLGPVVVLIFVIVIIIIAGSSRLNVLVVIFSPCCHHRLEVASSFFLLVLALIMQSQASRKPDKQTASVTSRPKDYDDDGDDDACKAPCSRMPYELRGGNRKHNHQKELFQSTVESCKEGYTQRKPCLKQLSQYSNNISNNCRNI